MEENKAAIGVVIFLVMVVGINFVMYGIVRGWTRTNNKDFMETLNQSFNSARKKDDPMNELRRKMEELEKGKKE